MKEFSVEIQETTTFNFTVFASNLEEARDKAAKVWREAATTNEWESPDGPVTSYEVTEKQ